MSRTRPKNHIVTKENWEQVNPINKRLLDDFIEYCNSSNKSDKTCEVYRNGLRIVMVWILEQANNVPFVELKKKDYVKFNSYLINTLQSSPNRISFMKSCLSSFSHYIERICDDEFPDFRSLAFVIEGNGTTPVWEKNIVTKEEVESTLKYFISQEQYQDACILALMYYSGMRKSEVVQVRVDDFTDDHLVFGGKLYKTHIMRTKGRGKKGKQIGRYVFSEFKPYYDLWMADRERRHLTEETLFVNKYKQANHSPLSEEGVRTVFYHMAEIVGHEVNPHCIRHTAVTERLREGWTQEAMKDLIQWNNISMVGVYNDAAETENLESFLNGMDEAGIQELKMAFEDDEEDED